jgi:hypothetical protein
MLVQMHMMKRHSLRGPNPTVTTHCKGCIQQGLLSFCDNSRCSQRQCTFNATTIVTAGRGVPICQVEPNGVYTGICMCMDKGLGPRMLHS